MMYKKHTKNSSYQTIVPVCVKSKCLPQARNAGLVWICVNICFVYTVMYQVDSQRSEKIKWITDIKNWFNKQNLNQIYVQYYNNKLFIMNWNFSSTKMSFIFKRNRKDFVQLIKFVFKEQVQDIGNRLILIEK